MAGRSVLITTTLPPELPLLLLLLPAPSVAALLPALPAARKSGRMPERSIEARILAVAIPTSPNPHTTIASCETGIALAAAAAASSSYAPPAAPPMTSRVGSNATRGSLAFSASWPRSGVRAIVISTIVVSREPSSRESTPSFSARASTTKANSPPPASRQASRMPCAAGRPLGSIQLGARVATPSVRNLSSTSDAAPVSTVGSSESTSEESKDEPASMKKMPSRIPLKGRMSAWICAR
mmetsp:Transcript_39895/g.105397  ORF Transcript_39895/g.105397 Transcript_39895/m.105397 type:complete len:239 (-) Transcript_39895:1042-1758(-)